VKKIKDMSEKELLEFWATINLIRYFRSNLHQDLKLVDMLSPPDPDVKCLLGDKHIYIEIGHLYGDEVDARQILGRSKNGEKTHKSRVNHACIPLSDRLPNCLNKLLEEKSKMRYGPGTWLLIRNAYPIWDINDFKRFRNRIIIPKNHTYETIWLICGQNHNDGVLKLFPTLG
jgi:hypothetical protein